MLRKMPQHTFFIAVKTKNPCLQAPWLLVTGSTLRSAMDSRLHGNDALMRLYLRPNMKNLLEKLTLH
jgi:hypothetical protein